MKDQEEDTDATALSVDLAKCLAMYRCRAIEVAPEAARMLSLLVEAKGDWVSMSNNGFTKPSRTKNSLPSELQILVESEPGKGYRIRPS